MCSSLQWPRGTVYSQLPSAVINWDHVSALFGGLMELSAIALELSRSYFTPSVKSSSCTPKLTHYPHLEASTYEESQLHLGEHTDFSGISFTCETILQIYSICCTFTSLCHLHDCVCNLHDCVCNLQGWIMCLQFMWLQFNGAGVNPWVCRFHHP
jgi:hypothetical protein